MHGENREHQGRRHEAAETQVNAAGRTAPEDAAPNAGAAADADVAANADAGEFSAERAAEEIIQQARQAQEAEELKSGGGGTAGETGGVAETAAEAGAETAEQAELTPEQKIAALEVKLAEMSDNYLRKAADFDNFRKRMNREKQDAIEYANQALLLDIIPIIDDFERAIQAAQTSGKEAADFDNLLQGITMIEQRLTGQLDSKWGLKRFDSAGEPFDPNRHEALMMEKAADVAEDTVAQDLMKGYTLKDRVIRTAKVKVLKPE